MLSALSALTRCRCSTAFKTGPVAVQCCALGVPCDSYYRVGCKCGDMMGHVTLECVLQWHRGQPMPLCAVLTLIDLHRHV